MRGWPELQPSCTELQDMVFAGRQKGSLELFYRCAIFTTKVPCEICTKTFIDESVFAVYF